MKKTLNVNVGSMAFTMDEDAYQTLHGYYDDIRSRLYESERAEIMDDIESRTADIFREMLSYPAQVVTIDHVRRAIATIGPAQTFGEKKYDPGYEEPIELKRARKLYRSRTDNVIGGVCGGVAEYFGVDATAIRLLTFFLIFLGGLSLWVYIIAWIVLPIEPVGAKGYENKTRRERP